MNAGMMFFLLIFCVAVWFAGLEFLVTKLAVTDVLMATFLYIVATCVIGFIVSWRVR